MSRKPGFYYNLGFVLLMALKLVVDDLGTFFSVVCLNSVTYPRFLLTIVGHLIWQTFIIMYVNTVFLILRWKYSLKNKINQDRHCWPYRIRQVIRLHPSNDGLIFVTFMPRNVTPLNRLIDKNVIRITKLYYRKYLLTYFSRVTL